MELPASFIKKMRILLGEEEYVQFSDAIVKEPVSALRVNPFKFSDSLPLAKIPWCSTGYYLPHRPIFTFDPCLHSGCYYVQDASSMFLEQALLQQVIPMGHVCLLDLCAAPGGKSTLTRSLLPEGSLLVANEIIRSRAQILAENLSKWGHPDVVVTQNEPRDFGELPSFFDVITADVPCSGEGMFRKDSVAVSEWSDENVTLCMTRQQHIIKEVWPALKSGGLLIYSTCTFNPEEDEKNVQWICEEMGAEVLPLDIPQEWGITGNLLYGSSFPVYRFLPHKARGEGFFLAVLRKKEDEANDTCPSDGYNMQYASKKDKKKGNNGKKKVDVVQGMRKARNAVGSWLKNDEDYEFTLLGEVLTALPRKYADKIAILQQHLHVVQAGIALAISKGDSWIPRQTLALSTELNTLAFPLIELSFEQAICYLRAESIQLPPETPRGLVLLTYRKHPIGFAKNLGNRANNLYQQEWRIRSTHIPPKEECELLKSE